MTTGLVGRRGRLLPLFTATFAVLSAAAVVPAPDGSKSSTASAILAVMPIVSGDVESSSVPCDLDGRLYSNEWTEDAGPLNARPPRGVVLIMR